MNESSATLQSLLKEKGYSLTKPRELVLSRLLGKEPMTMRELLSSMGNEIDRASVYRTIAVFEETGVTQRLSIGWKYKIELTDNFADHHHHLTCSVCKKIIPINEQELENFIYKAAAQNNFYANRHQVEIQGTCAACRA